MFSARFNPKDLKVANWTPSTHRPACPLCAGVGAWPRGLAGPLGVGVSGAADLDAPLSYGRGALLGGAQSAKQRDPL